MRLLICGDRNWKDRDMIFERMLDARLTTRDTIIEGCARGADAAAEAAAYQLGIDIEHYPAFWEEHGRFAGPLRNKRMLAAEPDEVWCFHDYLDNSKGSAHMVKLAVEAGIPVRVFTTNNPEGAWINENR